MRLRFVPGKVLLAGLLLIAAHASADTGQEDSLDWLRTAVFAAHQTDYTGVFVYQYGDQVESSRITHVVQQDSEYEKLESLDGPRREIIRHNGQVWCYINQKMEQVDSQQGGSRFPLLLPEQLSSLSANYRVQLRGVERVAGHNSQVILFQPKDNLRYTHKMWVHTDSGLLLKAAVLGDNNQLVEQYAFTQLKIGGDIDRSWINTIVADAAKQANLKPLKKATASLDRTLAESHLASSGWMVDALPAGFKKTQEIQRRMRTKQAPVTQLVFSDGLSAISVFIEPVEAEENDPDGLSSRGAMNLYHRVAGKHLFTVVGEVPVHTVIQVSNSVRRSVR